MKKSVLSNKHFLFIQLALMAVAFPVSTLAQPQPQQQEQVQATVEDTGMSVDLEAKLEADAKRIADEEIAALKAAGKTEISAEETEQILAKIRARLLQEMITAALESQGVAVEPSQQQQAQASRAESKESKEAPKVATADNANAPAEAVEEPKNDSVVQKKLDKPVVVKSITAHVGGLGQSSTGLNVNVGGSMAIEKPAIRWVNGNVTQGNRLELSTDMSVVSVGASEERYDPQHKNDLPITLLPSLNIDLRGSADADDDATRVRLARKSLDRILQRVVVGAAFDRNIALDREVLGKVYAGYEFSAESEQEDAFWSVLPLLEAGLGSSKDAELNEAIIPFVGAAVEMKGLKCFSSNKGKDNFCLQGSAKPSLGLVQVGLDANGGLGYTYKFETDARKKNVIGNSISVDAVGGFKGIVDLQGPHAAGQGGLVITVK